MKKMLCIAVALLALTASAQDTAAVSDAVSDDAGVVQSILTKCGLTLAVSDVATLEDGKVVSLDLKNRDISQDGITFIPPDIGKLTELRVFICSGNIIDSIPAEIASCSKLQKLDFSSNHLKVLPGFLGSLKSLTHLDVRHNLIETVAPEIAQCSSLFLLQLTGNKITELPASIVKMSSLKELYLKDNRLTTLPPAIAKVKFQYVDFIGNKLCTLPPALDAWAKKVDKQYKAQQKCW